MGALNKAFIIIIYEGFAQEDFRHLLLLLLYSYSYASSREAPEFEQRQFSMAIKKRTT